MQRRGGQKSRPGSTRKAAPRGEPKPPDHLLETDWLVYEYRVALSALHSLDLMLSRLDESQRKKNVHNARISFRRWYSIWTVLRDDGWQTDQFKKRVGKRLRKSYKLLGSIRDWDVNCKLASSIDLPSKIIKRWRQHRKAVRKNAFARLAHTNLKGTVKRLRKYMAEHVKVLQTEEVRRRQSRKEPAYDHLDAYLSRREEETRFLASTARTVEEIHALRLSIKAWRYILAEYFGVSSIPLVRAQKVLGLIVDYDRMLDQLDEEELAGALKSSVVDRARKIVLTRRDRLVKELDSLKETLPYGFRPYVVSQAHEK